MQQQIFKDPRPGIRVRRRPGWCSRSLWETLTGLVDGGRLAVDVQFSKAERKRLRKKKQIKPSVWAEKHRVLVKSRLPGLWKNDVTPYLVGIMDVMALPYVREVCICKAPQTGVSEATMNFIGSRIDLAAGDVLYTFPDQKLTNENFDDRIQPMIKNSARLRSYLTGGKKDMTQGRINLQHMTLYGAWASSVATISNKPIRYAVSDEIDKPGFGSSRAEASPLDLIAKRLITFYDVSTHVKISSPSIETGNIWIEMTENAEVVFDFHVRCPHCDHMQLMQMDRIRWDGGSKADRKKIKKDRLAWYECANCGERWDDRLRDQAVAGGDWIARDMAVSLATYCELYRPHSIGFHLPGWLSHFVSLSDCAASFLRGLESREKLKDHMNGVEALPWKEYEVIANQTEETVLACKCDLPPQTVPESAVALTCGIDVQKVGFWYSVRAWAQDYTSWNIAHGHLGTWADVERLLFDTPFPVQNSEHVMRIWRAGIDTGGGKYTDISSTEETYLWLQDHMGFADGCRVWGIKGASNALPSKMKLGSVLTRTPSGRNLKMGLRLIMADTNKSKDLFYDRMDKARSGRTGGAWLHSETGLDYAAQIAAEQKQEDGKGNESWVQIGSRDNHFIDCEYISCLLADWEWPGGGVNLLMDPVNIVRKKQEQREKKQPVNPFTAGQALFGR